ncbi:hypothetical protein AGMMS49992_05880 [Clostridia bacterium]|nr:hypothetical protein AGMMS49992_05880 [Clostridia bacterium]
MQARPVLFEVRKLRKTFALKRNVNLKAMEDISFTLYEGEKFGVVGESGCGKSTLGRVILQLYKQTSGACLYYGKPIEDIAPQYLHHEIERLPYYQQKAKEFYQKSLDVDKRIAKIRSSGQNDRGTAARVAALSHKSKELRKDASRQLREGSRTVGSLITSSHLLEVQQLFRQSHHEMTRAHESLIEAAKLEAAMERNKYNNIDNIDNTELSGYYKESRDDAAEFLMRSKAFRQEAFDKFSGRDVLPLTELCADPTYLAKLDNNYETAVNLGKLTTEEMRVLRRDMQMIFQDPAASLDPRQSVGKAIEEVFAVNTDYIPGVRREKAMALLELVGLKRERYYVYPHTLSGGQKQRVGIARAIALDPRFVVLDESVSALDVSVQAQILALLNDLSRMKRLTYLFITHDLGVVKYFCDRVMVMYLGNICELADNKTLFHHPMHPYTISLLASVPRPVVREHQDDDHVIKGEVPSALHPPKGCPFHTRCPQCMPACEQSRPQMMEVEPGHFIACFLYASSH